MKLSRRTSIGLLASAAVAPALGRPVFAQASPAKSPPRNPFLSAETYGTTHFDPAQSDAFPHPAPRGVFRIDLRKMPRIPGGPIGYMQLASTSPRYLWVTSTAGISYADISGGFRTVAHLATPGVKAPSRDAVEKVLEQRFTDIAQVEKAVTQDLGLDWHWITSNCYMFVDNDNVLYANNSAGLLIAYALVDPSNPSAGIKVLWSFDFNELLKKLGPGAHTTATNVTYDGKVIVGTNRSITVFDRSFEGPQHTVEFGPDESVSNSIAVDDKNGIYVASDTTMRKLVWTGSKLSTDEADGAWSSPYDFGREPPSVKLGKGTGATPTLMGFGDDPDRLVVITDGADRMKIVAFWRDQIPSDFQQKLGTKSRRIAGQFQITCGLSPQPEFIQSEQSCVVKGYGAFVVNNIRPQGHKDKLIDVFAGGPVFDPPAGAERVEWNPRTREWRSVWTRKDVVGTSMVPSMSSVSEIAFVNGYSKKDGWEVTGMDWNTGETVHRTIFGPDNLGNGAYATIQFLENGDLLFNSVGGATRVKLT